MLEKKLVGIVCLVTMIAACSNKENNSSETKVVVAAPTSAADSVIKSNGVKLAYFTNAETNNYIACEVNAQGIDSRKCQVRDLVDGKNNLLNHPEGITLYKGYVYIVNNKNNSYTKCKLKNSDIDQSACNMITPRNNNKDLLNGPKDIAFYNNYAYIINSTDNSYTQCKLKDGTLAPETCKTVNPHDNEKNLFDGPVDIAMSGNYAYVVNQKSNNYTLCKLNDNGVISESCTDITLKDSRSNLLDAPAGIEFNGGYAYIVNEKSNSYTQCKVENHVINPKKCSTIKPKNSENDLLSTPQGISFDGSFAYIVDTNSYLQCNVTENGIDSTKCTNITPQTNNNKFLLNGADFLAFSN